MAWRSPPARFFTMGPANLATELVRTATALRPGPRQLRPLRCRWRALPGHPPTSMAPECGLARHPLPAGPATGRVSSQPHRPFQWKAQPLNPTPLGRSAFFTRVGCAGNLRVVIRIRDFKIRQPQDRLGDPSFGFASLYLFHDPWPPPPRVDHAPATQQVQSGLRVIHPERGPTLPRNWTAVPKGVLYARHEHERAEKRSLHFARL